MSTETRLFSEALYWRKKFTANKKEFGAYDRLTAVSFAKFEVLYNLIEESGLEEAYYQWLKEGGDEECL